MLILGETLGSMKIGNIPQCIMERLPYIPISPYPKKHEGDIYNLSCFNYGLEYYYKQYDSS